MNRGYLQWPLVLDPSTLDFQHVNSDGEIVLNKGQSLRLVCTGDSNSFVTFEGFSDITVECLKDDTFMFNGAKNEFFRFYCRDVSFSIYLSILNLINNLFLSILDSPK